MEVGLLERNLTELHVPMHPSYMRVENKWNFTEKIGSKVLL